MSEMVERVARALCRAMNELEEHDSSGRGRPNWLNYENDARAAIEAMREPTEEMCKAAAATPGMKVVDALAVNHFARTGSDFLKTAGACNDGTPLQQAFRAMIDAALK